ncbi:MAG TPA: aldo/keto reductase [Candidatus Saccharimonadales bacterium]|nr:aldo/keto reductase [Candidatus Saccharimonadales bacterium]
MAVPSIKLHDGNTIPSLGLGLWKVKDELRFNKMFDSAIKNGYRHFDDAQTYGNEQLLGKSWKRSGLNRNDIFITTKISPQHLSYKSTHASFKESLLKLQTDYVDLLLVHFPGPSWLRKNKWRAIEEIKQAGLAKSIGVSNFNIKHLQALETYAHEMPVINQIEMHVFMQQKQVREYCRMLNIQIEAYSPLAHAQLMNNPKIQEIATKHHKTYSQIMLRWCVEQSAIPLPKSTNPNRLKQNSQIFDFELTNEELNQLSRLNTNHKTLWRSIIAK